MKVANLLIEVEIKAPVEDLKEVREVIKGLGGKLKSVEKQLDMYFQHPCRDFKLTDEALRLRRSNSKSYMTYKGPKISPKTKSRVEIEVEISDFEKALEILMNLGFKCIGKVNKVREIWKLKEVQISLDKVESLGDFIEIEVESEKLKEAEEAVYKILNKLNIPASKTTRKSYLEMIIEKQEM